ncbi:PAS-domain containing protein [Rhodobacter sp. KR11]|uniref:PAS-domain containing protein n=1 Tax=Rhodobacter sp. KR11 TaxID=2974588 RepID=UPI00222188F2|nr:PAS-domain containing protein [Rhodobacter sp. KR11]MCW1918879.1 PAS-domain containing protein [Rhodobacter sp. KR11]
MTWIVQLELVVLALVTAGAALLALLWIERRHRRAPVSVFAEDTSATVFLFDGDTMIDSTPGARALLAAIPAQGPTWTRLMTYLTPHFSELEARLLRLSVDGALTLTSDSGNALVLQAELRGGLTRVVLTDPSHQVPHGGQDMMAMRAMEEEISLLRDTAARAPTLIWKERANGDVIWANSAYMLKASEVLASNQDLTWPLPRIFGEPAAGKGRNTEGLRHRLTLRDGDEVWYDVVSSGDEVEKLHFATPINALVQAETSLRDFMVTLTKTFAHLHVGLAIFDSQRQLVLFNPALMDLTMLPADFLTMRPSLVSVLDGMRDRNMIPEPKDYRNWRRQITEMERAATSGLYEETWSLPGGQTYRVIGRPHPNGALALLIEDISSEMIRTRRFRADLEISQSVMDQVEEAIAVFSPGGQLLMSNAAYAELWGADPAANLAEATLRSVSATWRDRCSPSGVWSDLEDFAAQSGERSAWNADLRLLDGRMIEARFLPLVGGATMTGYRLRDAVSPPKAVFTRDAERKTA